jgi:hypothetical protein
MGRDELVKTIHSFVAPRVHHESRMRTITSTREVYR